MSRVRGSGRIDEPTDECAILRQRFSRQPGTVVQPCYSMDGSKHCRVGTLRRCITCRPSTTVSTDFVAEKVKLSRRLTAPVDLDLGPTACQARNGPASCYRASATRGRVPRPAFPTLHHATTCPAPTRRSVPGDHHTRRDKGPFRGRGGALPTSESKPPFHRAGFTR